jgi:flagellar assembly factor FliW
MKILKTRFGEVEYDPDNTISFPEGLIGFEHLRNFIVMPNKKQGPLFWIQSVEEGDIAFVVTDPTNFFLDYSIKPGPEEREKLGIGEEDEFFCLVIVTVPPSRKITLNLAAPVLFSPKTNRAIQVILENSGYDVKTPLPESNQ